MPAASEDVPLLARFRPRGVRIVGAVVFTVLAISPLTAWLAFNESARGRFVWADLVLLLFVGGLFAVAGYAVLRCRVDATEDGLVVVNGFRTRRLAWHDIARLGLPSGAPFARLETHDDETLSMLGIQGSDGDLAKDAVRELRHLHAERTRPQEH